MTKTYKTFENADYDIVTTQLGPREFMATTREFKAFGKTEPAALNTLAEMLRATAGSIGMLAIQRDNEIHEDLQRKVNPDCAWVSVSGCAPCVRESAVGQKCVSCRKFFGTPLKDEQSEKPSQMTPQALYERSAKYISHVLDDLHGFKFDHVHEADLAWWNMNTNERVTVRTIEDHVHSCGRRIWRLATVWLDERPVMVIQNAGREGDDHVKRFITDNTAFLEMVIYLRSLARQDVPDCNAVAAAEEIEGLDAFYGHKLGESWA